MTMEVSQSEDIQSTVSPQVRLERHLSVDICDEAEDFVDAETHDKQNLSVISDDCGESDLGDVIIRTLHTGSKNGLTTSRSVDMTTASLHQPNIASHLSLIDLPSSLHSLHNHSHPDLVAVNLSPTKNGRKIGMVASTPVFNGHGVENDESVKEEVEETNGNGTVIVTNTPATPQKSAQSLDALSFPARAGSRDKDTLQASSVDISPRGSVSGSELGGSPASFGRENSCEKGLLVADKGDSQAEVQDNISRSSDSARSLDLSIGRSGDNRERKEQKGSGSSDKEKRKRSTLSNVFNPTYKSRSDEFKRLFAKDLPQDERLLVDYSCALQRDILVHGRLYISPNYLCFYAKIFGWETSVALRFSDVTAVTKEKTALVIPNAVQISTENEKFFFASFTSRDKTFVTIFKIWQMNLLEQPLSAASWSAFIRSMYGEELGFTSEEEGELIMQTSVGDETSLLDAERLVLPVEQGEDASSYCSTTGPLATPNREQTLGDHGHTPSLSLVDEFDLNSLPGPKEQNISSTTTYQTPKDSTSSPSSRISVGRSRARDRTGSDVSELSDSSELELHPSLAKPELKDLPPPPPCPVPHDGRMMIDCVLPFGVDELFTMIFTASNFYMSFQKERQTTDLTANSWLPQDNGTKLRKISYTIQLASFGIKSCRTSESQVLLSHSQPGSLYSINCEIQNSGIPYSDTFYVLSHFCLSRVSYCETKLVVTSSITYNKSVWGVIKNFIEKNTWAGMEEYYGHLEKYLRAVPAPEPSTDDISRSSAKKDSGKRIRSGTQRHRRKTHSKGEIDVMANPIAPSIIVAGSNPPSGNDAESTRSTPAHRRRVTADGPLVTHFEVAKRASSSSTWREPVFKMLAIVLMALVVMNVLLFQRIGNLEVTVATLSEHQSEAYNRIMSSSDLPANYEDWVSLLRQQELNHRKEVDRWKVVIESSVHLLRQTEDSLAAVLNSMSRNIESACEDQCHDESRNRGSGLS